MGYECRCSEPVNVNDATVNKEPMASMADITKAATELLDENLAFAGDILKRLTGESELPKIPEPTCLTEAMLSNNERILDLRRKLEFIRYIIGGA